MSELRLAYPACMLVEKTNITPDDVELLNTRLFPHGLRGEEDVATVLAIEHAGSRKTPEWERFLIDALSGYIVGLTDRAGRLPADAVERIRRIFCRGGVIGSRSEFRAIIEAIEELGTSAQELAAFALDQIHFAVTEGEGPLAHSGKSLWARLGVDHLEYINRIFAALGRPEPLSITDPDLLFDPAQNLISDRQSTHWGELVSTITRSEQVAAA